MRSSTRRDGAQNMTRQQSDSDILTSHAASSCRETYLKLFKSCAASTTVVQKAGRTELYMALFVVDMQMTSQRRLVSNTKQERTAGTGVVIIEI